MELRQLRYFIAIAEEGSFSRAAERLHISQPPLSTQIKALEAELGFALLERGNRGVTLTPAGATYCDEVRALLSQLEQARDRAQQVLVGAVGRLAIGFVSIADYGILPPALKDFRASFPQVEVQLHELTTDAQIPELLAGRLHLGIALAPVDEPELSFSRIATEQLVLAAPAGHPLVAASGAVDLRQLAKADFIVPPRSVGPGLYDLIVSHCRAAGFVPRITQHARQMQTVIGLVSSGMGFALVPASVRNLQRAGVEYRPLTGQPALVELGILRNRHADTALCHNFAAALQRAAAAWRS